MQNFQKTKKPHKSEENQNKEASWKQTNNYKKENNKKGTDTIKTMKIILSSLKILYLYKTK